MKKVFIGVPLVGLSIGVAYWIRNKAKSINTATKTVNNEILVKSNHENEKKEYETNNFEGVEYCKDKSTNVIHERHTQAGSIMKNAYSNIMEEFVNDFSNDVIKNKKDSKSDFIDNESHLVSKELDSILDELDD